MLMGSRDLCRDGMHPGQGIEERLSLPVWGSGGVRKRTRPSASVSTLESAMGARAT